MDRVMKTSIETINGKLCTVVWHGEPINLLGRRFVTLKNGNLEFFKDADCLTHIATALPALPRNPTANDARVWHRYASEGLTPVMRCQVKAEGGYIDQITHAADEQGNRVEVAIES